MLFNLLDISDKLFNGLYTFVLGMVSIFLGITLIILVVTIVGKFMPKNQVEKQPKPVAQAPKTVTAKAQPATDDVPEHVKVAIMTALTAYYFNEGTNCEFIVKRIKRI